MAFRLGSFWSCRDAGPFQLHVFVFANFRASAGPANFKFIYGELTLILGVRSGSVPVWYTRTLMVSCAFLVCAFWCGAVTAPEQFNYVVVFLLGL